MATAMLCREVELRSAQEIERVGASWSETDCSETDDEYDETGSCGVTPRCVDAHVEAASPSASAHEAATERVLAESEDCKDLASDSAANDARMTALCASAEVPVLERLFRSISESNLLLRSSSLQSAATAPSLACVRAWAQRHVSAQNAAPVHVSAQVDPAWSCSSSSEVETPASVGVEEPQPAADDGESNAIGQHNAHDGQDVVNCDVCWDDAEEANNMRCCSNTVCCECIRGVASAVIEQGWDGYIVRCPNPTCRREVSEYMLRKALTVEMMERLATLQEVTVKKQGSLEQAYCPRKGCATPVYVPANASRGRCSKCTKSFCASCLEAHSRFMPCAAHEAKHCVTSPRYALSQAWKVVWTKPCPKCGERIEKNGGCSHMSCRCGAYFCWRCGHDLHKGGMHCKRWIAAGVVAGGAAAVVALPVLVPAAIVLTPVAVLAGGAVVVGCKVAKRRRLRRYRRRSSRGY